MSIGYFVLLPILLVQGIFAWAVCPDILASASEEAIEEAGAIPFCYCAGCHPSNFLDHQVSWAVIDEGTYLYKLKSVSIKCHDFAHGYDDVVEAGFYQHCYDLDKVPKRETVPPREPVCKQGSMIEVERRVLGEQIPVVGTRFNLVYRTDRDRARKADRQVEIPIVGNTSEPAATGYALYVTYDGGTSTYAFPYLPGQTTTFEWDGMSRSGQKMVGAMSMVFETAITPTPSSPLWPANPYKHSIPIGNYNAKAAGLGGWTISPYHFYDRVTKRLFKGDGTTSMLEFKEIAPSGDLRVVDESGAIWYKFNSEGYHLETRTTLENHLIYSFSHNLAKSLTAITDAFSKTVTITRDGSGSFTGITGPYGQHTTVTLNGDDRLATVASPAGAVYTLSYHLGGTGLLATFTKPGGQVNSYTYDGSGLLSVDERTNGPKISISQTAVGVGRTIAVTSRAGRSESYLVKALSFDDNDNGSTDFASSDGGSHTISRESDLILKNHGDISTFKYLGNDPRFGTLFKRTTGVVVSAAGISDDQGFSETATLSDPNDPFSYSSIHKTQTRGLNSASQVYSKSAHKWTYTSFEGRVSTHSFDAITGQKLEFDAPDALPISYAYDSDGRLSTITQGTRITTNFYNADGLLEKVRNALSQDTLFEYDLSGNRTKITFPDGKEINYDYDSNGKLTSITPPNGSVHAFSHGADTEYLSEYAPPTLSGILDPTTNYTYDLDGLLTQIDKPNGISVQYSYYLGGTKLASIGIGTTSNYSFSTYDSNGLPATVISPYDLKSEWTRKGPYITTDKLTNTAIPRHYGTVDVRYFSDRFLPDRIRIQENGGTYVGSADYVYDKDDLLTQVGQLTFVRDASTGQVTSANIGSLTESYTYDSYGAIATYSISYGGGTIYGYSITRDDLGRIADWTEAVVGVSKTEYYTYDSRGRLTDIYIGGVQQSHYNYSFNSNRTSGKVRGTPFSATFDAQDRIKTWNTLSFTYNANGDTLSLSDSSTSQTTNFQWDFMGQLREIQKPSGDVIRYKYDGKQRKAQILVNGSSAAIYLYQDELRAAAEMSGMGALVARYYWGDRNVPEYIRKTSTDYRLVTDPRGSVRLVVNTSTGSIVQQLNYDEWGRIVSDTNPGFQPFAFAGGLYDHRTGLVQFGARHYDGRTGRWLSKDPILFDGGDTNLYGYVFNDPINFIDMNGMDVLSDLNEFFERVDKRKEKLRESLKDPQCNKVEEVWNFGKENIEDAIDTVNKMIN